MPGDPPDFESRLELNLRAYLDPSVSAPAPAQRWRARRTPPVAVAGRAGAAFAVRIAFGAALAVLAAGATTGIALTHSVNPADWSRQVNHVQPANTARPRVSPVASPAAAPKAGAGLAPTPVVSVPSLPPVVPTLSPPVLPSPSLPGLP